MRRPLFPAIAMPILRISEHLEDLSDSELDALAAVLDRTRRLVSNRRCVRALDRRRLDGQGRRA